MKVKSYLKSGILILTTVLIVSCGNDDDTTILDANTDLIIGKWVYQTQSENGVSIPDNDCQPSTIEFYPNGDRLDLYYGTNSNGDCVVVDTVNGNWEKLSNGGYQFNFDVDTVLFENNNDRLILEDSDTNGNGDVIVYRFEYDRE